MAKRSRSKKDANGLLVDVVEQRLPASTAMERRFADLYDQVHDKAVQRAARTLDLSDASAIVSDVAYHMWWNLAAMTPEEATAGVFMTRVKYAILEHRRRRRDDVELTPSVEQALELAQGLGVETPDIASEALELRQIVDKTVASLPSQCNTVLRLAIGLELPHAEIAEKLGIARGTVAVHIALARKRIEQAAVDAGYRVTRYSARGLLTSKSRERDDD